MIELLAPAGDLEKLKIAILYGADAVFIGGQEFSLRARASNFSLTDIKEAAEFVHAHNKKLYVTTNIIPHNENMEGLIPYLKGLEEAKVDAIICASPYVLETARQHTALELHLSTQQSVTNAEAIKYWASKGVKRVVLARELSVEEIQAVVASKHADIEVFIHGGMCVSYSGRCTLSNNMTDRDANRGGCAHSCRWNYDLYDGEEKVNDSDFFSMSSKDLQAVEFIPSLIDAGVHSLKIEGRMKSIHYIATVVQTYRRLIDTYLREGVIEDFSPYIEEIKKAENRLTSFGFLKGMTTPEQQLYNARSEMPTKEFVGVIHAYDANTQIAIVEQRNHFMPGDVLEVFGPSRENATFEVEYIKDMQGEILDAARHPKQRLCIKIPFEVTALDMIRKVSS